VQEDGYGNVIPTFNSPKPTLVCPFSLFCSGGPGLLLGGTVIALKAFGDLGSDSLSPFPSPPSGASLKMDGVYGQMRHPMYTGLLMVMAGLSIASNSADRLLLTALLWFLIDIKAYKEEGTLCQAEERGVSVFASPQK
jgi:protein-S-isoprenylcysteine O-methyltransferase Ste14